MMKKLYSFCALLLLASFGYSQNALTDEDHERLMQEEALEAALLHNNQTQRFQSAPSDKSGPQFIDLDDDGMDDDWEVANGLNPEDPTDAWGDADTDYILNLFEFQLDTDPNESASPTIIEFTPDQPTYVLDSLVEAAESGIRVIRLAQGTYTGSVLALFEQDFRVMIQGGWNDDFTVYNPREFPTYLQRNGDEVVIISVPTNNTTVNHFAIVMDGINFHATDYFGLFGAVQFTMSSGSGTISIYNCTAQNCTESGLGFISKSQVDQVDVYIANTVLGNNLRGGIYTQVTDGSHNRWRLFNTTIHNPNSSYGGIDGLTSAGSELTLEMTNCINWGNNTYALNFFSNATVYLKAHYCNMDSTDVAIDTIEISNNINANPLFLNAPFDDFRLTAASPCVDAGTDIGLPFLNAAPDMGAIEFAGCVSFLETSTVNNCGPYEYNGVILTESGVYSDTLLTSLGCDSVIQLNLQIDTINTDVEVDGATLSATMADAVTYQWIDCSTNLPIDGATDQSYEAPVSGDYAVEISTELCTDVSECYSIVVTNIQHLPTIENVRLFPSPVTDVVSLDLDRVYPQFSLELISISGQSLRKWSFEQQQSAKMDLSAFAKGVYFMKVFTDDKMTVLKLVRG